MYLCLCARQQTCVKYHLMITNNHCMKTSQKYTRSLQNVDKRYTRKYARSLQTKNAVNIEEKHLAKNITLDDRIELWFKHQHLLPLSIIKRT